MPTIFTHAVAGLAIGTAFQPADAPPRFWIAGAACAMVPDLDWAGAPFGLHYEVFLGDHRCTLIMLRTFEIWARRPC